MGERGKGTQKEEASKPSNCKVRIDCKDERAGGRNSIMLSFKFKDVREENSKTRLGSFVSPQPERSISFSSNAIR